MRADDAKYLKETMQIRTSLGYGTLEYTSGGRLTYYNKYGVALHNLPGDDAGKTYYLRKGFTLDPPEHPEPMPDAVGATLTVEQDQNQRLNRIAENKVARRQELAKEAATGFEDDDSASEMGKEFSAASQNDTDGFTEMCKACADLAHGDTQRKAQAELGRHVAIEHPK